MTVKMQMEKATKNTIKFTEILEHEFDAPKVGTIYIPKATLGILGWNQEKEISITVEVAE